METIIAYLYFLESIIETSVYIFTILTVIEMKTMLRLIIIKLMTLRTSFIYFNTHFTPFIVTDQIPLENMNDVEQINDLSNENALDGAMDHVDEDNHIEDDDALDANNVMEVDGRIPIYTNYYKHGKGHLDFHRDCMQNIWT